jgi:hypothetical protein
MKNLFTFCSGDKDMATLLFGVVQLRSELPAPEAGKFDYHYWLL